MARKRGTDGRLIQHRPSYHLCGGFSGQGHNLNYGMRCHDQSFLIQQSHTWYTRHMERSGETAIADVGDRSVTVTIFSSIVTNCSYSRRDGCIRWASTLLRSNIPLWLTDHWLYSHRESLSLCSLAWKYAPYPIGWPSPPPDRPPASSMFAIATLHHLPPIQRLCQNH